MSLKSSVGSKSLSAASTLEGVNVVVMHLQSAGGIEGPVASSAVEKMLLPNMAVNVLLGPELALAIWAFEVVYRVLMLPQALLASKDPITMITFPCLHVFVNRKMCSELKARVEHYSAAVVAS
jgi:hypothetical protein